MESQSQQHADGSDDDGGDECSRRLGQQGPGQCAGAMAMLFTKAGYAALSDAPRGTTTRASLWLLGATLLALGTSVLFRGDQTLAAVIPIIALAVLQRFLVYRAGRPSQTLSDN